MTSDLPELRPGCVSAGAPWLALWYLLLAGFGALERRASQAWDTT